MNDFWFSIVIIGLFLAFILWLEMDDSGEGTWKPPSGSSYQHSEGREGWHLNPLNGRWNPGLWSDAQHAIIFDD